MADLAKRPQLAVVLASRDVIKLEGGQISAAAAEADGSLQTQSLQLLSNNIGSPGLPLRLDRLRRSTPGFLTVPKPGTLELPFKLFHGQSSSLDLVDFGDR